MAIDWTGSVWVRGLQCWASFKLFFFAVLTSSNVDLVEKVKCAGEVCVFDFGCCLQYIGSLLTLKNNINNQTIMGRNKAFLCVSILLFFFFLIAVFFKHSQWSM